MSATETEVDGVLDRPRRAGWTRAGIGIGILNAYAPGAGVQELTAVCELAAAQGVPTFTHIAYMSRIRPGKRRRGLCPPDRLCRRHRRAHAHLPLQQLQQDGCRTLRAAGGQGAGAGPAHHRGGLSLRHRLHRAGRRVLQRPRVRGTERHRLRHGAAGERRAAVPRSGGTAGGRRRRNRRPLVLWHILDTENNEHHRKLLDISVLYPEGAIASDAMPLDAGGRHHLHRRRLAAPGGRDVPPALGRHVQPLHPPLGAGAAGGCRCRRACANVR